MVDLEKIEADVTAIIRYSQAYPDEMPIRISSLMKDWFHHKKYYINLFGNNTRSCLAKDITIHLNEDELETQFYRLIEDYDDMGILSGDLDSFLKMNKKGVFNNRVVTNDLTTPAREGMKLGKCLKYFIEDKNTLRQAQDKLSEYIQMENLRGSLWISVDPRDFLSCSENNFNWRSCQSLDGDFNTGTLSLALDNTTLLCYFAPDKEEQLKAFPKGLLWNSKIWRMFIHTKEFQDVIYWGKQYPFYNSELLNLSYQAIQSLIIPFQEFTIPTVCGYKTLIHENGVTVKRSYNLIESPSTRNIYETRDIIDYSNCLAYPDLTDSPSYVPTISYCSDSFNAREEFKAAYAINQRTKMHRAFHAQYDISIGEVVPCVCGCGNDAVLGGFLCNECMNYYELEEKNYPYCANCGRRLWETNEIKYSHWNKVNKYCRKCYKEGVEEF